MNAPKFVGLLMNSRTQSHAFHLTTKSYAEHKALQASFPCSMLMPRRSWESMAERLSHGIQSSTFARFCPRSDP